MDDDSLVARFEIRNRWLANTANPLDSVHSSFLDGHVLQSLTPLSGGDMTMLQGLSAMVGQCHCGVMVFGLYRQQIKSC